MTEIYMHYHDESAMCECGGCGHECTMGGVEMISDFEERVAPGEICPAGECPECGSLMHLKDNSHTIMLDALRAVRDEFGDLIDGDEEMPGADTVDAVCRLWGKVKGAIAKVEGGEA